MTELCEELNSALAAEFEEIAARLHKWAGPLSREQFWRNPFSYGNSAGHLVLHVTGNLNYYIGAKIAATGYVRDRPREFAEAEQPPKEDVLANFDRAIAMVTATIHKMSGEDWTKDYSAEGLSPRNRLRAVLHCVTHADHHVGQIINLSRELRKGADSRAAAR